MNLILLEPEEVNADGRVVLTGRRARVLCAQTRKS